MINDIDNKIVMIISLKCDKYDKYMHYNGPVFYGSPFLLRCSVFI